MPNPPRIPKADVIAKIRQQVARNDRTPFADILADALSVAPSKTAFRQLARQNPRQYVSMVKELAELNGYAQRTEHRRINVDASDIAAELTRRVGAEEARRQLAVWDLPASLVPDAIAGEAQEVPSGHAGQPQPPESGEDDT